MSIEVSAGRPSNILKKLKNDVKKMDSDFKDEESKLKIKIMKRINIIIDDELHTKFKVYASINKTTITDLLLEYIKKTVKN
jgi:hypothetical protein